MSKFAIMLKSLREEKGLNVTEVAKALGMTRSRYANYELGIREPDLDTLELISDYFNVDVDYILGKTSKTTRYTSAHDQFNDFVREESSIYDTTDNETMQLLEELHKNPDLKVLLYEGSKASPESLKALIQLIKSNK